MKWQHHQKQLPCGYMMSHHLHPSQTVGKVILDLNHHEDQQQMLVVSQSQVVQSLKLLALQAVEKLHKLMFGGWLMLVKRQVIQMFLQLKHQAGQKYQILKHQVGQKYQIVKHQAGLMLLQLKFLIGMR